MASARLFWLAGALGTLTLACARSTSSVTETPSPSENKSKSAPNPDPRVGLRAGKMDAAEAVWNLRVLSKNPPSEQFVDQTNSDLDRKSVV